MNIKEYRKIMEDEEAPDEKVLERISIIRILCQKVVDEEFDKFINNIKE